MRIGINLLYLLPGLVGGTETYAAGLLYGLSQTGRADEYMVFVNEESAHWPMPAVPNLTRVICPVRAFDRSRRYFYEQIFLPGLLRRYAVGLVHSLGYVGPLCPPCRAVVTVPDLNYIAIRQTLAPAKRLFLAFFSTMAARRAQQVITISQFSKRAICEKLKIAPNKVTVTLLGPRLDVAQRSAAEIEAVKRRYGISRPYVAAIGGTAVHKNVQRLLDAFASLKQRGPYLLVLIGHLPPGIKTTPIDSQNVVVTGYVPSQHLFPLLGGAEAFIMPSWHEGFGLPVLEAQQAGTPVLCSNAGSLPEVAGEGALFFNPYSIADIAEKTALLLQSPNLRADLRRKGLANVKRFSWEQTARETSIVYERAIRSNGSDKNT